MTRIKLARWVVGIVLIAVSLSSLVRLAVTAANDYETRVDGIMDALQSEYQVPAPAINTELHEKSLLLRECTDAIDQVGVFSKALWDVGHIPYRNPGMNCLDHSVELQRRLAEMNIESSIYINEGRKHAWVAVWVDAVNGKFIPTNTNYKPVLEVRDRNMKVICD